MKKKIGLVTGVKDIGRIAKHQPREIMEKVGKELAELGAKLILYEMDDLSGTALASFKEKGGTDFQVVEGANFLECCEGVVFLGEISTFAGFMNFLHLCSKSSVQVIGVVDTFIFPETIHAIESCHSRGRIICSSDPKQLSHQVHSFCS